MIRFYYLDADAPDFGDYYCDSCAYEAGVDPRFSRVSTMGYCPTCRMLAK